MLFFYSGAVDELGDMPYYAEHCAAMLAVTYSSGQGNQRNIVSGQGSGALTQTFQIKRCLTAHFSEIQESVK